jgi:NAD(P)-dependent dehydrogenase (short-subunit alcohol dehydrogenase family)
MSFTRYGSLDGRTVIITGGANGIGAGFVRAFVENRAKVAFLDLQRVRFSCLATSPKPRRRAPCSARVARRSAPCGASQQRFQRLRDWPAMGLPDG